MLRTLPFAFLLVVSLWATPASALGLMPPIKHDWTVSLGDWSF